MTKTKTKLHPVSVAAVLKRAGLERSKWYKSGMIRGWGRSTEGFSVKAIRDGYRGTDPIKAVKVEWVFGDWVRFLDDAKYELAHREKMESLQKPLEDSGFVIKETKPSLGMSYWEVVGVN